MGVLEQVTDLKNQGLPEGEITRQLQEQGIPPGEIKDALGRAQIKSAVSDIGNQPNSEGMEQSIMGEEGGPVRLPTENIRDEDLTPPVPGQSARFAKGSATREISDEYAGESGESDMYYPQENQQFQQGQEYYPSESYGDYSQTDSGFSGGTDTMIEIAEQVFSEKIKALQRKLDELNEFKSLTETRITHFSERLKKMEAIIDALQNSVLEKVGSYGRGLETIKKEMGMMQESFGKMVGSVAARSEHRTHTPPKKHVTVSKSRKTTTRKPRTKR
jgi:hypothetical protein